MSNKPILGYWAVRGRAHPIRMLLTHLGVDYEERLYHVTDAPEFDVSDWFNEKHNLGLDFPNIPYFIDGDVRISQTLAILQYICLKYRPEYLGRDKDEQWRTWEIGDFLNNHIVGMTMPCYMPTYNKENVVNYIKSFLPRVQNYFIGRYLVSDDGPTWVDFKLFEMLQWIEALEPGLTAPFEPFKARMHALPGVASCLEKYAELKFNNKMAAVLN